MHSWLIELKENPLVDEDLMIYIVGTKLDIVNEDPSRREVPFEDCVAYAVKHLARRKRKSSISSSNPDPKTKSITNKGQYNSSPLNTNSIKSKLAAARSSRNRRHTFSNANLRSRRNSAIPTLGYPVSTESSPNSMAVSPKASKYKRKPKNSAPTASLEATKSLETPEFFTEYNKSKKMQKSKTHNDISSYLNNNVPDSSHQRSFFNEPYDDPNDPSYRDDIDNDSNNDHPHPTPLYHDNNDVDDEDEISESELEFAASCCHEISAKTDQGIDEVFEAITRRLVEQYYQKRYQEMYRNEKGYYQEDNRRGNTIFLHHDDEMQGYQKSESKCC